VTEARAGAGPYFVSAEAAQAVFVWQEAIGALQAAYAQPVDPAIPPGSRYFGAKLMGMATAAANPGVEYVIVLFDRQTSRIAAFLDANLVTGYRTAATSAAALDRLAPPGPARLGVLGSGLEASMHTRAFAAIRPLEHVAVFSPTPARRETFAVALEEELGIACTAVDTPEEVAAGATIVLAAARSRGELPILFGEWLEPGTTVVSIGSTVPDQREIDVSVVERCDLIVCDTLREVLEQTGDMLEAAKAGVPFREKSFALNDLIRGDLEERRAAARFPMFKSVGGGLQDVVVAELVFEKALAAGLATPLPIAFSHKKLA
jgi:ornithine cyclodeaminase/alanine dehydrogenase-like protein (mu-crystallin family)